MHRLAHRLVTTEREGHVRHTARHMRIRQVLLDAPRSLDELDTIVIVFINAGRDRKNIRIEDNVFRWETDPDEQIVRTFANLEFTIGCIGLPVFVKGHDNCRRAVAHDFARVFEEGFFTFLETDRIHNRLALHALQTRFDNRPFGRVDHDRHAGDVRLGGNQIEEAHHRRLTVEHAFIHVDIDDLRAALDLLQRNGKRLVKTTIDDQLFEFRRARHVGAFTDIDEAGC